LNNGLLMADIKAHPLATDSLEFKVLDGSMLNTSLTKFKKAGILVPPPISSMLCKAIFLVFKER
jgi:hypothetical protein